MLQIKEDTVDNVMSCIAKAVHPNVTYIFLNNLIGELQQLKPIENENEKKKEEEDNG